MLNLQNLHHDLIQSQMELIEVFKKNVLKFAFLNKNERFCSENMFIECLKKEVYDNSDSEEGEFYYTFWWNHYQKSENHIINLSKNEGLICIEVSSSVYKIIDKPYAELTYIPATSIFEHYHSLYYANKWFEQLTNKLE